MVNIYLEGGDTVEVKNNLFYENEIGISILNWEELQEDPIVPDLSNIQNIAISGNVFLSNYQYAINSAITT